MAIQTRGPSKSRGIPGNIFPGEKSPKGKKFGGDPKAPHSNKRNSLLGGGILKMAKAMDLGDPLQREPGKKWQKNNRPLREKKISTEGGFYTGAVV